MVRLKRILRWGYHSLLFVCTQLTFFLGSVFYALRRAKRTRRKILIVRLDEIGDMVLMSPFLRELRHGCPQARITLVVKPAVFNLVELCPYVDEVLAYPRAAGRFAPFLHIWQAFSFARKNLWAKEFTLAIVPRFDADASYGAGWLAFFSGAKRRLGYPSCALPSKEKTDRGLDRLYTDFVPVRPGVCHEVERNLDVLRYLGIEIHSEELEVWTDAQDEARAEELLSIRGA